MRHKQLEPLFSRHEYPTPSVLSVYLDTDESKAINLNRGFEKRALDALRSLKRTVADDAETGRFDKAALRIAEHLAVYAVHSRGLGVFYDGIDDFFWTEELNVPVEDQARWDCAFFLQPLVNARDEFERYAIVLLDHANMRLFRMFLGNIEEVAHQAFNRKAVQHIRSVGMDHLGSANHAQHRADEQVRINVRSMIQELDALVRKENIGRLIVAGSSEMTAELISRLPKRLASLVVDSIDLPFEASPAAVFAAASPVAEVFERKGEVNTVRAVVDTAARRNNAVIGLSRALAAVNQGRVWQLVYSERFRQAGFECTQCASLVLLEQPNCVYCGGTLRAVSDVVEHAVEHAIRRGGSIEIVRGEAADELNQRGGIAAFLKTRTSRVKA